MKGPLDQDAKAAARTAELISWAMHREAGGKYRHQVAELAPQLAQMPPLDQLRDALVALRYAVMVLRQDYGGQLQDHDDELLGHMVDAIGATEQLAKWAEADLYELAGEVGEGPTPR